MRHLAALVAVTLLLSCSVTPVADEGDGKTLYGLDDRVELREASQPLRNAGASVVALFGSDALIPVADGRWRLRFGPSGAERGWCPDERFSRQPRGALCSGFLIAPDRIATSAHCVRPPDDPYAAGLDCDEARFVFGFGLGADGEPPAVLTPEQVYRCAAVIDGEGSPNGADWRVVRLDRAVSDRLPLPVYAGDTPLARGTALTVIGHPIGLPAKVAPGGAVTDGVGRRAPERARRRALIARPEGARGRAPQANGTCQHDEHHKEQRPRVGRASGTLSKLWRGERRSTTKLAYGLADTGTRGHHGRKRQHRPRW